MNKDDELPESQHGHVPRWDVHTERWKCWTCGQLLIVCTEEELKYGLADTMPPGIVQFLTRKDSPR